MSVNITIGVDGATDANSAIAIASRYIAAEDATDSFVDEDIDEIQTCLVEGEMQVSFVFDDVDESVTGLFRSLAGRTEASHSTYTHGCRVVHTSAD